MVRSKIVHYLKEREGFVSGEELSKVLEVSRAAVWKHIEELRADGYEIEAVSHNGYRLTNAPDKLLAAEIRGGLATKSFGAAIHYFDSVASTMDEAFRLGTEGAAEGTVVVAETQTKGRGRLGRAWSSPKGKGIYFSILLRPACSAADAARFTLVAAVAVSEAIERVTGLRPLIKWPNDLLVNERKICGILTELRGETDRAQFVVIGFGINVNNTGGQLLPEATSLREATGEAVQRVKLLQEILRSLEARYFEARKEGCGPAFAEWRRRSATLGKRVRFVERQVTLEGTAVDLHEDGGLLVKLASGEVVKRMAGDVLQ